MSESCNICREGDEMVCHTHARRWDVGTAPACPAGNPDALPVGVAVVHGRRGGKTARAEAMKRIEEILKNETE